MKALMQKAHDATAQAPAAAQPIPSLVPGVATGGVEKKHTKKKKKRVRGEKARERTVLRQDERPAEVKLKRGKIRELDVAARPSTEAKMPRKMRALFAAKRGLEAKAAAKQLSAVAVATPLVRGAPAAKDPTVAKEKKAPVAKRKSNRELVIETVKKTTRQYEKKKMFHAKREERAAAAKEKKKRRRRKSKMGSDVENDDDDFSEEEEAFTEFGGDRNRGGRNGGGRSGRFNDNALEHVTGFTSRAQAQAPPKLKAVVERHRR